MAAKGKTAKDLRDNGWFVFFAPRDNPQIAGAIFVEHGGHGGTTAAPIARNALEIFFAKKEGRAIPTLDTNDLLDPEVGGDEPVGPPTAVGPPEAN